MTRLVLLLAGVVLLLTAVIAAPTPPSRGPVTALSALGGSLGGLKVGLVDLLFLRAERLRREGRVEEVPALYQAILELDPGNAAAIDYLVAVYAYDLRTEAASDWERFAWWARAWNLLQEGLALHPDDATLRLRTSDLLLEIPAGDDVLGQRILAVEPRGEVRAIADLLRAARLTPTLPRRGRIHLLRLALLLPVSAATGEGLGEDWYEVVQRAGAWLLEERGEVLREVQTSVGPHEEALGGPGPVPLEEVLREGLATVARVRAARLESDEEGARQAIRSFAERYPLAPLSEVLVAEEDR